jgi:hypothetical protein
VLASPYTPGLPLTLSSLASISTTSVSTSSMVALQQEWWVSLQPAVLARVSLGLHLPLHLPKGSALGRGLQETEAREVNTLPGGQDWNPGLVTPESPKSHESLGRKRPQPVASP